MIRRFSLVAALLLASTGLSGCLAFTVADAATSAAVGTVKTGAKVTGTVVGGAADVVHTSDLERCLQAAKRERFDRKVCYEGRR
jgi:ABC-type glycerol-3-phosphate transport system substrate-binding protein